MPILETYEYDYLGNRTAKTSNGVTTEYTTDLSSGYSQVLKAETDTSTVYYTRGFELISRKEGTTASYYVYDGGLSVRALTNEAGTVTDTFVFDAFGNETGRTGTTDNPYGFQGEEQDATGLYYLRARCMDPATGTFTTMDTYGGSLSDPMSLHKYLFANSNPVMYCDPSGHFSLAEMDAAMAIDIMLDSSYISGFLYIVDASITDPELEHHDIMGYFGAVGFGFIFSGLSLMLSSFVTGALVLAIINTVFASMGVAKGIQDFDNGHVVYGPLEAVVSVVGCAIGWNNFTNVWCAQQTSELIHVKATKSYSNNGISIDPNEIRFSQSSVNGSSKVYDNMMINGWDGDPIDVVRMPDNKLTTIDNTRVVAAREAGIDVQAVIHDYSELLPLEQIDRFTTKKGIPITWGDAIILRIGKQSSAFRSDNPYGSYNLPVTH